MSELTSPAAKIEVGDQIQLGSGKWVTVTSKSPGIYRNSVHLEWQGKSIVGWSCVLWNEDVPARTSEDGDPE